MLSPGLAKGLACRPVGLLACWLVGLLACCLVGLGRGSIRRALRRVVTASSLVLHTRIIPSTPRYCTCSGTTVSLCSFPLHHSHTRYSTSMHVVKGAIVYLCHHCSSSSSVMCGMTLCTVFVCIHSSLNPPAPPSSFFEFCNYSTPKARVYCIGLTRILSGWSARKK